jgi:hypothetical protein
MLAELSLGVLVADAERLSRARDGLSLQEDLDPGRDRAGPHRPAARPGQHRHDGLLPPGGDALHSWRAGVSRNARQDVALAALLGGMAPQGCIRAQGLSPNPNPSLIKT